jgi:Gpi18-like mannosyltransferase
MKKKKVFKVGHDYIYIFDDKASYVHTLFGAVSVLLRIEIPATLIYLLYQYIDREREFEKKGDLIEYTVGLLAGALVRTILGGVLW